MITQKNLIFNISFENETCSFYVLMLFLSVLNLDALENEKVPIQTVKMILPFKNNIVLITS